MPNVAYIKCIAMSCGSIFQEILMYSLYNIMAIKSIITVACFTA